MKPSRIALYEFMPYGAPELLEASQPNLTRAIATASGGVIAAFGFALALATWFAAHPGVRVVELPPVIDLFPAPIILEPPHAPNTRPIPPIARPVDGPVVPVHDDQVVPNTPIAPPSDAREGTREGVQGDPPIAPGGASVAPPTNEHPLLGEFVPFDEAPVLITSVTPVYPDMAREAGVDGFVQLRVLVGRDGRVKDVHIDRSVPMLDDAAVIAVRKWVFTPAFAGGRPVAVWVAVPVHFTLH